jgi:hypothetical protein
VRRRYLSDGKTIVQDIISSTKPGAQKRQFPYELPVIQTAISIDDGTKKALYTVTGVIGAAMIGSAILKRTK